MDRRAFIASAAGVLTSSASLADQPSSGRAQIVGVWKLRDASTVSGDDILPWFGRTNPVRGLIVYHESGWVSVQISGTRPTKLTRNEYNQSSIESKVAWLKEYYAYYGRFEVDEASSTIIHTVTDSLIPERNSTLRRTYRFEGDDLVVLTEPRTEAGKTVFNRLIWTKVS